MDRQASVRAVLLDVDGVLVQPGRFRSWLERQHGITPAMTAAFFKGPFVECTEGRADLADVLAPFLGSWGWKGTADEFIETWLSVENAPNAGVLAAVSALREGGVPCFAASTQERRRSRYLAADMGFERLLDGLFFSCEIGVEKPDPGFFEAVQSRLGLSGPELLFFDDLPANVDAARRCGWSAEIFTTVGGLRRHCARHGLDAGSPGRIHAERRESDT